MSLSDPNLRRLLYLRALSLFVIAPKEFLKSASELSREDRPVPVRKNGD